jgi:hypothetical protein
MVAAPILGFTNYARKMISYELHTLGKHVITKEWAIDAVFEDRALALPEAAIMDNSISASLPRITIRLAEIPKRRLFSAAALISKRQRRRLSRGPRALEDVCRRSRGKPFGGHRSLQRVTNAL